MTSKSVDCKKEIKEARHQSGPAHEKREAVLRLIKKDLASHATLCHDGRIGYIHYRDDHRVLPIGYDHSLINVRFREDYGLLPREEIAKDIEQALTLEALGSKNKVSLHRSAHYDQRTGYLYLSDLDRKMVVIPPVEGPLLIQPNGDDGVLFVHDSRHAAIDFGDIGKVPAFDRSHIPIPFDLVLGGVGFVDGTLTVFEQQLLFFVWFLALFFPELFPTRPILAFLGPAGSGKTWAQRRVGILLFGADFNVTPLASNSRDFDAAVTNQHLVVLDNLDTRRAKWLADRLAIAATGGTIQIRALYENNVLLHFPIVAYLGVSARTPVELAREDIADRLLVLEVGRRDDNRPEHAPAWRGPRTRLPRRAEDAGRSSWRLAGWRGPRR